MIRFSRTCKPYQRQVLPVEPDAVEPLSTVVPGVQTGAEGDLG